MALEEEIYVITRKGSLSLEVSKRRALENGTTFTEEWTKLVEEWKNVGANAEDLDDEGEWIVEKSAAREKEVERSGK